MPAKSKSQQRLFGMVHAYQKGEFEDAPEHIKDIAAHISEEDAEHFAKTKHRKLPEKKAGIELREGPYEDVKKVYDALTPEEKNFVTPGRAFYKDVPYTARRVAYDEGVPVGFADLYGLYDDGSPRSSQNLTLAVSDVARGRRVAKSMVDEAIEAAVVRARQKKNRRTKVKRIIWSLLKENEASARAAANSGFTERIYDKPHSYRRFVKDLAEKRAAAAPALAFPTTGPVGFRNNNPGNLKSDGRTLWEGATNVPAKGEWLKFNTPTSGIRAMSRTLYNYGNKHGINTVEGVVNRFAPVKDRNSNNSAYLSHIRSKTGFKPRQVIDLTKADTLHKLVPAMGSFEIGQDNWGTYSPSVVSNAVIKGIPVKTTQKRTVK